MLQFYCMVSAVWSHCTAQHKKRCLMYCHFITSVILHNFTNTWYKNATMFKLQTAKFSRLTLSRMSLMHCVVSPRNPQNLRPGFRQPILSTTEPICNFHNGIYRNVGPMHNLQQCCLLAQISKQTEITLQTCSSFQPVTNWFKHSLQLGIYSTASTSLHCGPRAGRRASRTPYLVTRVFRRREMV